MKKVSLFFITCILSASFAWADVSVTEKFALQTANIKGTPTARYQGDLCKWDVYANRRTTDVITVSGSEMRCWWLTYTNADTYGYIKSVDFEGGIKKVNFRCAKFGNASSEVDNTLKLSFSVGSESYEYTITGSPAKGDGGETSSFTFAPNNGQLVINNASIMGGTEACRILVGNITITPYLHYRNKEVTIGSKQKGYVNQDLIDNTESGSITYSSDALGVATIDPSTGVVTPVAAGDAVITATWSEGVATTYTLHVVDGIIVENFSKVLTERPDAAGQEMDAVTWQGDLFEWTVRNMRRGVDDTIGLSPRKQATAMRKADTNTYLQTNSEIEGGVKHIQFNYRQWASASGTLTLGINYGKTGGNWDTPAITHDETAATASTPFEFDEDIDDGTKGNNYMRLKYSVSDGGSGHIVIENIKITPWLLYTTKKAIIDLNQTGFVNNDLINNTGTNASYESSATSVADVDEDGVITPHSAGETTITASWGSVSTTYKLYVEETVTEDYSKAPTSGVSTDRATFDGNFSTWAYRNARSKTTDKLNSGIRGFWLSPEASANNTYLESTTEGGIKKVNFNWRQFDKAQNDYLFVMSIKTNSSVELDQVTFTGADSYVDVDQSYSKELAIKRTDSKLTIQNLSTQSDGTTKGGKIIVGPITITPYLLYTDKYKKFMRIGGTYTNTSLINNTGSETGTLSYRSSNDEIATVDSSTGEVTGVAEGTVTITAKFAWDGSADYVETTYQVEVLPANCETFDGIEQTSNYANTTPRAGDKATWSTSLGGFNVGECAALTTNLVRFRAPYQESSDEAYIQSTAIEGGIASMTFDWNLGGDETPTNWDIRVIINGREVKHLNNEDITATNAMDHFEQITINDINEPDNFTIRFENHSTINGAYTSGNKARFLIDNIRWTSYSGTKTLAENVNNEGWIRSNGGTTRNVAISRSALQGGKWNTLCLPFAISKSTDLNNADVQEMTDAVLSGDELEIVFNSLAGDELAAGTPYLVKPTSAIDISKTYTDKQISMIASPFVQGIVTLQGIFSPKELTAGDKNSLFVGTPDENGDNLFYPEVTGNLLGFRAYFKISEGGASSAPAIRRARFIVNEAQSPTALDEADNALQSSRKVLENGHLFIIRDGKKYNVTGQKIQ